MQTNNSIPASLTSKQSLPQCPITFINSTPPQQTYSLSAYNLLSLNSTLSLFKSLTPSLYLSLSLRISFILQASLSARLFHSLASSAHLYTYIHQPTKFCTRFCRDEAAAAALERSSLGSSGQSSGSTHYILPHVQAYIAVYSIVDVSSATRVS